MAMLTFLRIGKEIYDETEAYLVEHMINRQRTAFEKALARCRSTMSQCILSILKKIGLDDLL